MLRTYIHTLFVFCGDLRQDLLIYLRIVIAEYVPSRPLFSLLSLHNQQVGSWAWSKGEKASSSKRSETKYLATTQFHFLRTFTAACVSVSSRLDYCCSLHLRRDFFFFPSIYNDPNRSHTLGRETGRTAVAHLLILKSYCTNRQACAPALEPGETATKNMVRCKLTLGLFLST